MQKRALENNKQLKYVVETKIDGYSWNISVGDGQGGVTEVYNSGTLSANSEKKIDFEC